MMADCTKPSSYNELMKERIEKRRQSEHLLSIPSKQDVIPKKMQLKLLARI